MVPLLGASSGLVRSLAAVVVVLAPLTGWEAFLGHFRSGFSLRAQYAPLFVAAVLTAAAAILMVAPGRFSLAVEVTGWTGVAAGLVGVGYHHYYGIVEKPGGYGWLLHQLMHHAPALAPLSHAALGALLVLGARSGNGQNLAFGIPIAILIADVCAITLAGAVAQSAILHYRGAFNNALMYVPVTIPLLAAILLAYQEIAPSVLGGVLTAVMLWLTFISGFLGFGMHIRGIDRQMGGFYVGYANLMQGPPLFAPLIFSGFSAAALVALPHI